MDYTFTSAALIFPAISLLMLAYTQRFLTLSDLVRNLYQKYILEERLNEKLKRQILNLKKRLKIIQRMQIFGATSFVLAALSMIIFPLNSTISFSCFIGALIFLIISLAHLLYELQISVHALNIQLNEIE